MSMQLSPEQVKLANVVEKCVIVATAAADRVSLTMIAVAILADCCGGIVC